jgi:hypothetical protein
MLGLKSTLPLGRFPDGVDTRAAGPRTSAQDLVFPDGSKLAVGSF